MQKSYLKADGRRYESRNSLLLWSPKAYRRMHTNPRLGTILSTIIQSTHFHPTTARKIRYKIILPSTFIPKDVTWGLLIVEASISPSDTPHLIELLCKSDQPDAETST